MNLTHMQITSLLEGDAMIGEGYVTLIVNEVALLRIPVMGSSVIGSWTSLYVYDFSHGFECCSEVDSDAYDYQKRKTNF